MDSGVIPSPRKARKSMKGQRNTTVAPNVNQPVPNVTSSTFSSPMRKNARKSMRTHSLIANTNQSQSSPAGISAIGISQNTTLSQPSCSRDDDDSSDSDVLPPRTRNSVANSMNSTVPLSQPGGCIDLDSSDSDVQPPRTKRSVASSLNSTVPFSQPGYSSDSDFVDLPTQTQKLSRRSKSVPASKTSKKTPAQSSSLSSSSEESDVGEILSKKATKQNKTKNKIRKSSSKETNNVVGKPLANPENLVSQCVFYILVANKNKKAIKKKDIIQHVFDGRNTQMFPDVLKKAASTLQKTFGFELMELKSSKNEYLLVNKLCHQYDVQEFAEYSPMDCLKQGFIFYILALIFMNENSIQEEELWTALEPLEIDIKSRKPHPFLGDVQKFVTNTLVKQMYLERKQISKDPPQFEIFWGERAHKEVLKEDLLEFVCKVMPDTKPEEWISQYKDAKGRSPEDDPETEME